MRKGGWKAEGDKGGQELDGQDEDENQESAAGLGPYTKGSGRED